MPSEEQPELGRLLEAIVDAKVLRIVAETVELSTRALDNLASLDPMMYRRFGRIGPEGLPSTDETGPSLVTIADSTMRGVRALVEVIQIHSLGRGVVVPDADESDDINFDLESDKEAVPTRDHFSVDEEEIDDAFGFIATGEISLEDRWENLQGEFASLCYALRSRLAGFDSRFTKIVQGRHFDHALQELDDTANSLTDGVYALVGSIYEAYLGEVDHATLIPGHHSSLGRALTVRRGLTDLRRAMSRCNTIIQDVTALSEAKIRALDTIRETLSAYLKSESYLAMRTADRVELQRFFDELAGLTPKGARLICEGLDKYLDSLAQVSRRDVLIRHDREILHEIVQLLEAVEPLVGISPHGAVDMVRQAFSAAKPLYGFAPELDDLQAAWQREAPGALSDDAIFEFGRRLLGIAGASFS